jgi:hypothetical protein
MSNGSFGPFDIGVFTTRVVVFRVALVAPRARRIAMPLRGGKNDARERLIAPSADGPEHPTVVRMLLGSR